MNMELAKLSCGCHAHADKQSIATKKDVDELEMNWILGRNYEAITRVQAKEVLDELRMLEIAFENV
jgi:hypothetical protein